MRILLACFLLLLMVQHALGQAAVLRSGEHEGFTRFVLTLPNQELSEDIRFNEEPQRFQIDLPSSVSINLDAAFARIARSRVSRVSHDRGRLIFEMSCNCAVTTDTNTAQLVIIDFHDSPSRRKLGGSLSIVSIDDFQLTPFWLRSTPDQETVEKDPAGRSQLKPEVNPLRIADFTSKHVQQVTSLASRGLLIVEPPSIELQIQGSSKALKNENSIRATTSLSQPLHRAEVGDHTHRTCQNSHLYNIADWRPENSFISELAKIRGSTSVEFDDFDQRNILELARLYAYYSFGAESKSALDLISDLSAVERATYDIASFFEQGRSAGEWPISLIECEGPISLWALAHQSAEVIDSRIDERSLNRELDRLPDHLRSLILPHLVDALAASENEILKLTLERRLVSGETQDWISRAPSDQVSETDMLLDNHPPTSQSLARGTREAAESLIQFVADRLNTDSAISDDIILSLSSLLYQFRGTDFEKEILRSYVAALSKNGRYTEAFAAITRRQQYDDTLESIVSFAVLDENNISFLKAVTIVLEFEPATLSDNLANAIELRLVDLGFPEMANQLKEFQLDDDAMGTKFEAPATITANSLIIPRDNIDLAGTVDGQAGAITPRDQPADADQSQTVRRRSGELERAADAVAPTNGENGDSRLSTSDDLVEDIEALSASPSSLAQLSRDYIEMSESISNEARALFDAGLN